MHRTIVQNKIISSICSCIFFYPANIYRPSLGKVQLGRPNQNLIQPLNFYLRRKKKHYPEFNALQQNDADFKLFKKKIIFFQKISNFLTIYIIIH